MEERPAGAAAAARPSMALPPVAVVADDRVADRGQVHPDLVGSARLQPAAQPRRGRGPVIAGLDLVAGASLAATRLDPDAGRVADRPARAGRRSDRCRRRRCRSTSVRYSRPTRRLAQLGHQGRPGRRRSGPPSAGPTSPCRGGARFPAGRAAAWPPVVGEYGQVREPGQQAVHQGAAPVACPGMDDQTRPACRPR